MSTKRVIIQVPFEIEISEQDWGNNEVDYTAELVGEWGTECYGNTEEEAIKNITDYIQTDIVANARATALGVSFQRSLGVYLINRHVIRAFEKGSTKEEILARLRTLQEREQQRHEHLKKEMQWDLGIIESSEQGPETKSN